MGTRWNGHRIHVHRSRSSAQRERRERYGDFDIVNEDYAMVRLWMLAVPSETAAEPKQHPAPVPLTDGEQFSVGDFSWAPDSKRIAFDAQRDPDFGSADTQTIYVVQLADKTVKKVVDQPGPNEHPIWSPDGKRIAFITRSGEKFFYYINGRIAVVSAQGDGPARVFPTSFDEDPDLLEWSSEGIYFGAYQKTESAVFRLNTATDKVDRVSPSGLVSVLNASFTADHQTIAGIGARANQFSEVFVSHVKDFAPKFLTHMSDQWSSFHLATNEVIQWKSVDGTPIEGILMKPADYDPARKYPLLVVIHGGPTGVDTPCACGRPLLSERTVRCEGRADSEAQLSRIGWLWRKVPVAQCAQSGLGRLSGRDLRRGLPDCEGIVDKERVGAWDGAKAVIFRPLSPLIATASRPSRWARVFPIG